MADIILVEDNAPLARAYKLALEEDGHAVRICETEAELEAALAERWPELLLLDIALPGVDGLEVLRSMRGTAAGDTLKVVVLSNYTDDPLASPYRRSRHSLPLVTVGG